MTDWTSGTFAVADLPLEKGGLLRNAEMAYLHAGRLAPDGCNAVLVTHGYTTGHHFVLPGSLAAEGSWSELVGPGRAIDTDRHFVVSTNVLGSCYGSTGPGSVNPATGRAYAEDFPQVTLGDSVRMQRMLLESLGVNRLHAVAGPSMGGCQAFLWGVEHPDWVDRLVVAVSGLRGPGGAVADPQAIADRIREQPGWNHGYPAPAAMEPWLVQLRLDTLRTYSMNVYLRERGLSAAAVEAELHDLARRWAQGFHPWCLASLGQAIQHYDVARQLHRIRARVLLALCANDAIFPSEQGPGTERRLREAGVDARFFDIPSRYGHLASGLDWQLWEQPLRELMA